MVELDTTDKSILNALGVDARMSNVDLADKVHLSPSACLRRVRRLLRELAPDVVEVDSTYFLGRTAASALRSWATSTSSTSRPTRPERSSRPHPASPGTPGRK